MTKLKRFCQLSSNGPRKHSERCARKCLQTPANALIAVTECITKYRTTPSLTQGLGCRIGIFNHPIGSKRHTWISLLHMLRRPHTYCYIPWTNLNAKIRITTMHHTSLFYDYADAGSYGLFCHKKDFVLFFIK